MIRLLIAVWFGLPIGALLIWGIVRWTNRRDDPRRAKRPPDNP